jgi:hypothetical protein
MKYLILSVILVGLLSFVGAIPTFADTGAGVSVTLTTIITGGSSGGDGGTYGWGSYPVYTTLENQGQATQPVETTPQSSSPYIPPQQTWIPIPDPPLLPKEDVSTKTPTTVVEEKPQFSMAVMAGIAFWSIIIGIGVWLLWWFLNRRKSKNEPY